VHESSIDEVKGKVTYDSFCSAETSQFWLYEAGEASWESARLVSWLDSELRTEDILQHELQAFLFRVIRHLTDSRKLSLAELAAFKYRLLEALRTRLSDARKAAARTGFELFSGSEIPHRKMNWSWDFFFDLNRPPYTQPQDLVAGGYRFAKHFFPVIQDIKDRGEELECAKIIDGRVPDIATWVRNIPRRPESFHLPTSGGEFYPDFGCPLVDGRVLVVEYKGDHLKDDLDEGEKKLIGEAWARVSGGKALFAWIRKRDEAGRDVYGQLVDCVRVC
jgi:type III restriction enzyme